MLRECLAVERMRSDIQNAATAGRRKCAGGKCSETQERTVKEKTNGAIKGLLGHCSVNEKHPLKNLVDANDPNSGSRRRGRGKFGLGWIAKAQGQEIVLPQELRGYRTNWGVSIKDQSQVQDGVLSRGLQKLHHRPTNINWGIRCL